MKTVIDCNDEEFIESLNYLREVKYINIVSLTTQREANLFFDSFNNIEARLAREGIEFLKGKRENDCIEW